MSTVTTYFDAVLDGTQQYLRPLLPCSIAGQDNDAGFSTIWYAPDILATDQTEQNGLYNYATQTITPNVSGNYTLFVDSASGLLAPGGRSDTQIWLYDTTFDPLNPLENVIAANEDIDFEDENGQPANWLSHLPNMALVAGHSYVVVVTTYSAEATGFANFTATGPGDLELGEGPPDTTPPVVESVGVPASGTYGAGEHLDFTITFSESVMVETTAGKPTLGLVIGGQTVQAIYTGGTGTSTLTFRYTLQAGQEDVDGIDVTELTLVDTFIQDYGLNHAELALHGVGDTSGVLVGNSAPSIVAVAVPAAGTYGQGAQLNFTVTLDEAVIVDTSGGTPRIALDIGGQTVHAHYVSGSGTAALVFQHTLASGMADSNGITVGSLSANGGTLKDAAGNDAALALHGVASTASVLVDSAAPSVVAVAVPAAGTYALGAQLNFTVTLDEAVTVGTVGGTPRIALDIGGQTVYANYVSGSGTTALVFQHTLATGRYDTDGITIGALSANGGTLKDAAGNDAALALQGVASTAGVLVDSVPPSIFGNIGVPAGGSYRAGDTLTFNVVFDDNVIVTGTDSTLGMTIGSTARFATFASKTQNSITYTYTVQAGDNDTNGIAVNTLSAGTGTIRDAAGNDASLTLFRHVPSTASILVDTRAPAVTAVAVPQNGTHTAGTALDFTVTFDENVTVTGTDGTLALTIGATARSATFVSSTARTVTYRYIVQAGDNDADGIAVGAISTGTGAIRDVAGNNAALSLTGRVPSTAGVTVDTHGPAVSGVTVPQDGSHKAGTQLDFTVAFDEAVTVTGTDGTLALTIGGTARNATFLSTSGNTITYRYTVQAGDNDADGIAIGALSAGAGTIRDAAGNHATLSLAGHVPSTAGILVDTRAPVVSGMTVPQDGTHAAGTPLDFTVAFDEAVAVTGTDGTLALTIGGTARSATFLSSSGNTVTYRYVVQAGDNDADGIAVGAISAGTGAIRDAAGNNATLSLAGHVPSTAGIVVDAKAPAVSGVSVPQGGIHAAGTQLDFTVTFDEAVTVTGADSKLALVIGGAAHDATFLSTSGNTVTYRYTVQAGDNDADGITVGALALGMSTIRDAAGNDAALSLAGHVPSTAGIVVDGLAPAVAGVTVPQGGTHGVGTQLDFTIAFDEAVTVTGTDGTLALTIGGVAREATFVSGSGSTVTYRYIVQAGDNDADGITVGALALGTGTIRDAAGNDAVLSLAGHVPPTTGIVVDTQAPAVTGVSVPQGGTHGAGTQLDFTVAFDEAVTVTGTDGTLALTIGGTARDAAFVSSSGNTVTYRYVVQAGDNDADGIEVGAIGLGAGAIRDAAGNDAALSLAGHVPSTAGILVDTQAPAVTGVTVPQGGTHGVGTPLDFTVAFDEAVTVTGTDGSLALVIGGTARSAAFLSGSGNTVTYRYIVQAGDSDADGIAIGAIDTGAGAIRDAAGNDATLSLAGHVPPTTGIVVDAQGPAVTGVTVPQAGSHGAGAVLDFTVAFDEAVTVTGTDNTLALTIGGTARDATFLASSGNTVTYRYVVQAGDNDADGIDIGAIGLGAGAIRDAAGNDAALSLAGHVPSTAGIVVDTQAPAVTGVTLPQDGVHAAGTALDFTVAFDEAVTVTGTDGKLALTIGGTTRDATFLASSGNTVTYRYVVQAGDADADGIVVGALDLGAGAIRDAAGNDAVLSLAGHVSSTIGIGVDGHAPAVAGITVPQAGTHGAGTQLDFTVAFDEAVTVTGSDGTLALTIGGAARDATFVSSSGNTVTYRYVVQAGDNDADGIDIGAIDPGTGAIRDAAGNDAALSLAGHVPSTAGIVVDTRAPAVAGVSVPQDGPHGIGTALDFTVAFDEAVTVTGTDGSLALTIGGAARSATFLSASGNTVTYRYVVQPGDSDADGITVGALALGTGTIKDAAGNDAALSLAGHVPPTAGIVVDTHAPAVAGMTVPQGGSHGAGTDLDFTVAFDEAVTVTGTDGSLALTIGGAARSASFLSSSGNTVTYRYTVQAGDIDTDGIGVGAIDPGAGTIRDAAGNDAVLSLAGHVPPTTGILVDTLAPAVTGVTVPQSGTHGAGEPLDFTITFDEAVTVTGSDSTLALTIGGAARSATLLSSGGNAVTYRYVVQPGDSDADGIVIGALELGTSTITDAAGNDATLVLAGHVPGTGGIQIDADGPVVAGPVGVPAAGTYAAGDTLVFTVTFDSPVIVQGGGNALGLVIGGTAREAVLVSAPGGATLTYAYTVQPGDSDADGIAVTGIVLNASTITDAAGNDAALALGGHVPPLDEVLVDAQAPSVAGVAAPADGAYGAGDTLSFTVAFDENVIVDGKDSTLDVIVGGATRTASFASSSGNAVTYTYTVQAGENDADGIAIGALALGTSTIRDAAGNDALVSLAGHLPQTGDILVDTQAPEVTGLSTPANGVYGTGTHLDFTVAFSENVTVTGTGGTLGLAIGGDVRDAVFLSSSGNTVTYRYTVQAGDADADGIGIVGIALDGGTIRDAAGNDATLALAGHVPPLAGVQIDTTIPVDTQAPSVQAVGIPANGTYAAGGHLEFTVTFDENVTVTGTGSTLGLMVGSTVRDATFVASSGATVTYRYTVQAGDSDADGIAITGLALNGGTIRDAAGNDATLVLAGHVPPMGGVLVQGTAPDTTAPVFSNATINGRTLVLSYQDAGLLDAAHGPAAGAFTVMAGGTPKAISSVVVDAAARTVTLTLATAVLHDQPVTVAYADPTGGNDAAAIQDTAGNDAVSLATTPVLNTTAPILTPPPVDPAPVDPPPPGGTTIDGLVVRTVTVTQADGSVTHVVTIPVVTPGRVEQVGATDMADIPLVTNAAGASLLTAQLPMGYGMQASGVARPATVDALSTDLIREIRAHTANGSADQSQLSGAGTGFLGTLDDGATLLVQTIVPTAAADATPGRLVISGAPAAAHVPTALVIDARTLPSGTSIELHDVAFAAVVGAVRIIGGAGAQVVSGDSAAQEIMLGAGDDTVAGGGGNDIIEGGGGMDVLQLSGAGRADYALRVVDGNLVMTHRDGGADGTDVVGGVETLSFASADRSVAGSVARLVEAFTGDQASVARVDALVRMVEQGASLSQVAHLVREQAGADAALDDAAFVGQLYENVLHRLPDSGGMAAWLGELAGGMARVDVALGFTESAEKLAMPFDVDFDATDVATIVRMYDTLFDRLPDEGGLNHWIGTHEAGVSMTVIADAFVASAESQGVTSGFGDAEFVTALYRAGLDRVAEAGELRYWTDLLAGGQADRGDVLLAFADSPEKVALVGAMSTTIGIV